MFLETFEALKAKNMVREEGDLTEMMGYARFSHSNWIKEGKMPYVAALACEALRKRLGNDGDDTYMLLHFKGERVVSSRVITKPNTAEFNNQKYFLIPVVVPK